MEQSADGRNPPGGGEGLYKIYRKHDGKSSRGYDSGYSFEMQTVQI